MFNFLGGQHKGFSPNPNTQETVNMFLEVDSSEENKLTLYRVDGKKDFIELPKSPIYNMAEFRGAYRDWETDRKSTRLNSSHSAKSRMPSSA